MERTVRARERITRLHEISKARMAALEYDAVQGLLRDLCGRVQVLVEELKLKPETSVMDVVTTIECDELYRKIKDSLSLLGVNPYLKVLDDMEVEQKRVALVVQRK